MTSNISKLMMANLMEAWCDNKLRCSSSRGVFKPPDARFLDHSTLQITAADGSFNCSLSPSTVTLIVGGNPMTAVVNANSFGDNGVWIQVSCRCHGKDIFWLELYVPNTAAVEARGLAERSIAARGSTLPQLPRA
jgi:hypothetical protein